MNYQEMSDLEIVRRVGDLVEVSWADLGENYNPLCIWVDGDLEVFDPITSWADAGLIAHEYKISIHAPRFGEGWMAEHTWSDEDVNDGFEVDYFEHHHENPCRAICIVFLMMKGGE